MTDAVKIYHNPRCSKSRETLSLLQSRGIDPEVVLYLETPPDAGTLRQLLQLLGMESPRELMRQKEDLYKSLNLADPALSNAALIQAMVDNPKLIERPIVVSRGRAYWPPAGTGSEIVLFTRAALARRFLRGRFQIFHANISRPPDGATVHPSLNPLDG